MSSSDEIKQYKTLLESFVVESYTDRVASVANEIIDRSKAHPFTPDDVKRLIHVIATSKHISDYSVGGNAQREFIKDVAAALKGKVSWKKSTKSVEGRLPAMRNAVKMVNRSLEYIPDGLEPIDYILDNYRKYGFSDSGYYDKITDTTDFHLWMNIAAKAIIDGHEYASDETYMKYITPAAMKAASNSHYFSDLVDELVKSFIEDHPDLAKSLGYGS